MQYRQFGLMGLLIASSLGGPGTPTPAAGLRSGGQMDPGANLPPARWSLRVAHAWKAHPSWVYGIAWFPGGRRLVSVGADDSIRLWHWMGGPEAALIGQWNPGMGSMFAVAVLDDGRFVTAGREDRLLLWRLPAGDFMVLGAHESDVETLSVIPERALVFSGGRDRQVRMWSIDDAIPPIRLEGHAGAVVGLAVSPDRQWLASVGEDGILIVWSIPGGPSPVTSADHGRPARSVAFVTDEVLASGDTGGRLRLWRRADGSALEDIAAHAGWVTQVAVCPDSASGAVWVATAGTDRYVRLWQWDGSRLLTADEQRAHAPAVLALAFSDGCRLASGGMDGWIRLWEIRPGGE